VKRCFITFILFISIETIAGQHLLKKEFFDLKTSIQNAGSIILVTHEQTDAITIFDEQTGKKSLPEKVVVKWLLNNKIIHQKLNFPDSLKGKLIDLFTKPVTDSRIETCRTFIPFYAIILFKKGIASFIDVSPECNLFCYETIQKRSGPYYIDKAKGGELSTLFNTVGIDFDKE
jgi:hypothetical protein